MFSLLTVEHETFVRDYLNGTAPVDQAMRTRVVSVLQSCRAETVNALKSTELAEARRELKLLYEGLTLASEFIALDGSSHGPVESNSSNPDETVPPGWGL